MLFFYKDYSKHYTKDTDSSLYKFRNTTKAKILLNINKAEGKRCRIFLH